MTVVHEPGLRVRGLKKSFGNTQALRGLDLFAPAGQITGIAGPNGAGKSTFVGILAGEQKADDGLIEINGMPLDLHGRNDRVALVHQEPQLFPNLLVWENILVGRENSRLMRPRLPAGAVRLLEDFDLGQSLDTELSAVPLAAQQRVEIVRALARSAEVLVFDEPNSALSESESLELFQYMRKLADDGRVVLLVSHRIGELVEHCSSVVVILDGRKNATLSGEALTEGSVARALVDGATDRDPDAIRERAGTGGRTQRIGIGGGSVSGLGFESSTRVSLRAGEVTAFVGVEGSGARAFVQAMGAADPHRRLHAAFADADAGAPRMEFVPAHRQHSLFANMSIAENIGARLVEPITGPAGIVSSRKLGTVAEQARRQLGIKLGRLSDPISTLSGGNQQKVAIAAAIARNPDILVLEEPTRGVDIGSRAEIYRILTEYAASGRLVCLYCTEIVEVFRAAHRAFVFKDGRIAAELDVLDFQNVQALSQRVVEMEWS